MRIPKRFNAKQEIEDLRAALQKIADSCPVYKDEYDNFATPSDFGGNNDDYAYHIRSMAESAIGDIARNILNPPEVKLTPTKVYAKVNGKLASWEAETQDPIEASNTVREVIGIKGAVLSIVKE